MQQWLQCLQKPSPSPVAVSRTLFSAASLFRAPHSFHLLMPLFFSCKTRIQYHLKEDVDCLKLWMSVKHFEIFGWLLFQLYKVLSTVSLLCLFGKRTVVFICSCGPRWALRLDAGDRCSIKAACGSLAASKCESCRSNEKESCRIEIGKC